MPGIPQGRPLKPIFALLELYWIGTSYLTGRTLSIMIYPSSLSPTGIYIRTLIIDSL